LGAKETMRLTRVFSQTLSRNSVREFGIRRQPSNFVSRQLNSATPRPRWYSTTKDEGHSSLEEETDAQEDKITDADREFLQMLASKGINPSDLYESDGHRSVTDQSDGGASDHYIEEEDEAEHPFGDTSGSSGEKRKTVALSRQNDFHSIIEELRENDPFPQAKEINPTLADFAPRVLKKWVTDAAGAMVGKGFYNDDGDWVAYNKLDKKRHADELHRLQSLPPLPTLTFRVTALPGGKEGFAKRAFAPPVERTRLPEDLQGKYRFGLDPEVVDSLDLSPKLKRVLSFAYANEHEIRSFRLKEAIKKWGKAPNDCGNTAVQLIVLTDKIRYLTEHLKNHHKDQTARRKLSIVLARRRTLFKYLKRRDVTLYYELLKDRVIEDNFLMHKNE